MFCPKCGTSDQQIDSYCKRCGEWLPDTTHRGRRGRFRARTPEQRHRRMHFLEALSALFGVSSALIIYGVLDGSVDRSQLPLAAELGLVIAVFQIVAFVIGRSLEKRLKQSRSENPSSLIMNPETNARQLNQADAGEFLSAPSVTERTTALLEPSPRSAGQSHG